MSKTKQILKIMLKLLPLGLLLAWFYFQNTGSFWERTSMFPVYIASFTLGYIFARKMGIGLSVSIIVPKLDRIIKSCESKQ